MDKIPIRIPDPSEVFNDVYLPFALGFPETLKPTVVFEGGRGSGKSREVAQNLVKRSLENKIRIALVRKVAETIRDSQYREIKDVCEDWGVDEEFRFISSPLGIRNSALSNFITRGLDKSTKIKSIANVDVIWVEEAEELTLQDWIDLSLSIRGKKKGVNVKGEMPKQIILTFNRTAGNWTEKEFFYENGEFKPNPDIYHLHTTFKDNKFLDDAFLNRLEIMRQDDPELYRKHALGMPIKLKGLIYDWKVVDEFPENCKEIIYGLDFGYSPDPTVLLKIGRIGLRLFVQQMIYEYKFTNTDLIAKMNELNIPKVNEIYADSAEPDRIEEIARAGYYILPADKGPGSVEFGIDVMKRYEINLISNGTEARKDYEIYKWKSDKNGEPISPPTPGHAGSHTPDATRYPVATHWGKEFRNLTAEDMRSVKTETKQVETISKDYFIDRSTVSQIRNY